MSNTNQHIPGKVNDSDIENMKKYGQLVKEAPEKKQTVEEFTKDALEKGRQEADNIRNKQVDGQFPKDALEKGRQEADRIINSAHH